MADVAFLAQPSLFSASHALQSQFPTQFNVVDVGQVAVQREPLSNSSPSVLPLAAAAAACAVGITRRRNRRAPRTQGLKFRGARLHALGQAESGLAVDLDPGWLSRGPAGEPAASFPFPHWIWQHAIARFEAAKLADPLAIMREDLEAAWKLHHECGYISHAEIEDNRVFPALLAVDGGENAVAQLAAHHSELDAVAAQISHSIQVGVDDTELRGLLRRWSDLLVEHMNLEESLIIPLVAAMPKEASESLGKELKKGMRNVPGSKMILCLFRDVAATDGAARAQYDNSFPGFLRYVLIPTFSRIDKQYANHQRVFGKMASSNSQ